MTGGKLVTRLLCCVGGGDGGGGTGECISGVNTDAEWIVCGAPVDSIEAFIITTDYLHC